MLRLFVDGSLNAVKLRIYGSSGIKAILREPQFPDKTIKGIFQFFNELFLLFTLEQCLFNTLTGQ